MSNSCPIQPKEVTETYAKAGQIYADKVVAIRFDDVMEKITEDDALEKIADIKGEFVTWMREAGFDSVGYPEQDAFYDKIIDGLNKKFPNVEFEDVMDDDFTLSMESRIANYFDNNKKVIASKVTEIRKSKWDNDNWDGTWDKNLVEIETQKLNKLMPELRNITIDTPLKEVAQRAGIGIGKVLLQASGDLILEQAKASSTDTNIQKRYFVDTMDDWVSGDNGYIDDEKACGVFDDYHASMEKIVEEKARGNIDDYFDDLSDGSRQSFSDFFNKKLGSISGVPRKGRTPFLMAKKSFEYTAYSPPQKNTENMNADQFSDSEWVIAKEVAAKKQQKKVTLTEKSLQVLDEYLQTKDLNAIWNNAENYEQERAIVEETMRLAKERKKS